MIAIWGNIQVERNTKKHNYKKPLQLSSGFFITYKQYITFTYRKLNNYK